MPQQASYRVSVREHVLTRSMMLGPSTVDVQRTSRGTVADTAHPSNHQCSLRKVPMLLRVGKSHLRICW